MTDWPIFATVTMRGPSFDCSTVCMPGFSFSASRKYFFGTRCVKSARYSPYASAGGTVTWKLSPDARPTIAFSRPGMMLCAPTSTASGSPPRELSTGWPCSSLSA